MVLGALKKLITLHTDNSIINYITEFPKSNSVFTFSRSLVSLDSFQSIPLPALIIPMPNYFTVY